MLYYGVITWLAAVYVDRGWSEADAGNLVALFGVTTLIATAVMPLGADRIGTRRGQLIVSSLLILIGVAGIAVVSEPAIVWAIVVGAGMGAIFPIVLTLPVDVGGRPADVAATAAMMLLVGYILSAISPLAFGIARDVTGNYGLGLWLLIGLGVVLVALCVALTPKRLHRAGA
jgi:CP family cyanate transporter-like MFS transporter